MPGEHHVLPAQQDAAALGLWKRVVSAALCRLIHWSRPNT